MCCSTFAVLEEETKKGKKKNKEKDKRGGISSGESESHKVMLKLHSHTIIYITYSADTGRASACATVCCLPMLYILSFHNEYMSTF